MVIVILVLAIRGQRYEGTDAVWEEGAHGSGGKRSQRPIVLGLMAENCCCWYLCAAADGLL